MKIWAISDLHLGFSTGKWMDKFGDHWKDHHVKVEQSWQELIGDGDLVLVPGDFSWAMKPSEVAVDFEWLTKLPGQKVMIKGNHDYWWPGSHKKLSSVLPEGIYAIKKKAVIVDGVPIVGVRGGDFYPREGQTFEEIEARLVRERHELLLSIQDLEGMSGDRVRPPIALFHYPPFPIGRSESLFTRIVEDAGCDLCLYGHLHTAAEWARVFQEESRGVSYRLVSCDALDFRPVLLAEV